MDELTRFAITWALIVLIPGPDMVFVLTESMKHGAKSGIKIASGLCTGLIYHSVIVLSGVGVIISKIPLIINIIKYIGIIYLVYIGVSGVVKAFKSSNNEKDCNDEKLCKNNKEDKSENLSANKGVVNLGYNPFKRGLIMNVTNPKLTVFFLSLLPQFINIENNSIERSIAIVMILVGVAFGVFVIVSIFCSKLAKLVKPNKQISSNQKKIIAFIELIIYGCMAYYII